MSPLAIRRRHLVGLPVALAATALLSACGALTPSHVLTDISAVASSLNSALPYLGTAAGMPQATLTQIKTWVSNIQKSSASLQTDITGIDVTTVQGVTTLITQIANAALPFLPASSPTADAILAALALVPAILTAVGVTPAAAAPKSWAATAAQRFTFDQARARLRMGV